MSRMLEANIEDVITADRSILNSIIYKTKVDAGTPFLHLFILSNLQEGYAGRVFSGMDADIFEGKEMLFEMASERSEAHIASGTLSEKAILEKETILTENLYDAVGHIWEEGICEYIEGVLGTGKTVLVPLISDNEVFGVLYILLEADENDLVHAKTFADQVLLVLEVGSLVQ